MDPLIQTIVIGAVLVFCGFLLGKGPWSRIGEANLLKILYEEKLLDPHTVVKHFTDKVQASIKK